MSPPAWSEVHLETAKAIAGRRFETALDQLSDFLREAESMEERREALALRATVQLRLGDAEAARQDLELAHSLSEAGTYPRYTVELLLARTARDQGELEAARRLYNQALHTVVTGHGFSAGTALEGLLRVTNDSGRTAAEEALVRDSIEASWQVLELEQPVPAQVDDCARRIADAERRR